MKSYPTEVLLVKWRHRADNEFVSIRAWEDVTREFYRKAS